MMTDPHPQEKGRVVSPHPAAPRREEQRSDGGGDGSEDNATLSRR